MGGLVLALYPCNGDFIEFEYLKSTFNLAHLKKSPLVGL
ncbi:hypothetical protein N411_06185 [Helicobacter pylori FD535]|nr:hypothetical protein N411_06185 [Helicobacter pylori FD535]